MGLFHDTLGGLDDHPDLNMPEGFGEAITGAYDADLAESSSSALAKITATEQERDAALAMVQELKVQNFDLLMAVSANDTTAGGGNPDGLGDPAESDAELPDSGIEGLFDEVDDDGNPTKKDED